MATPPFKYGSTHVDVDSQYLSKLHEPWQYIREEELADEGIETDTHCTIRYGINDCNYSELYNVIADKVGPFDLDILDIDMFETKDGDCIKWSVYPSQWLLDFRSIVERIADCVKPTFPDYKPHITIAYVKKGLGPQIIQRIKENIDSVHFTVSADNFILTDKSGKRAVIPLNTSKRLAEAAIMARINKDLECSILKHSNWQKPSQQKQIDNTLISVKNKPIIDGSLF